MGIEQITRPLNRAEITVLKKLSNEIGQALSRKFRIKSFVIAILSGALSTYLAAFFHGGFFTFVFGTAAVICFCFVVFAPFALYKSYKRLIRQLKEVNNYLQENQVKVMPIHARQIAQGEEYEDEGQLFIIEYKPGNVLYLWDNDYPLGSRFPSLEFDIYDDAFSELINRRVYTISERIKPVLIDKESKWANLGKFGTLNLTTQQVGFETVVSQWRYVAGR